MTNDLIPVAPQIDLLDIQDVRGVKVVLDSTLAAVFGVETKVLNQAVKRNRERLPAAWVFQLSDQEFADLKSQSATSNEGAGGRRYAPWAFTEHGVVAAAGLLNSPQAIAVQQLVVEVFVETRRAARIETKSAVQKIAGARALQGALGERLQTFIATLMEAVVNQQTGASLREEALALVAEGIGNIKERLKRAGHENDEIAARAAKLLAEAEVSKAEAARLRAETDQKELQTLARKLRLVLEAEQAIAAGELGGFLAVLEDLGRA